MKISAKTCEGMAMKPEACRKVQVRFSGHDQCTEFVLSKEDYSVLRGVWNNFRNVKEWMTISPVNFTGDVSFNPLLVEMIVWDDADI